MDCEFLVSCQLGSKNKKSYLAHDFETKDGNLVLYNKNTGKNTVLELSELLWIHIAGGVDVFELIQSGRALSND